MKSLIFTILFLLICSPIFAVDYTADANCMGAWLMEIDEDPLTDSSGQGNTGDIIADNPDYATATPPDTYSTGYYTFDGNDYVDLGNSASGSDLKPTSPSITIVAWIRPSNDDARYEIFSSEESSGPDGYELSFNGQTGGDPIELGIFYNLWPTHTSTGITKNNWHHVGGVYKGDAANEMIIYIGGSADAGGDADGIDHGNDNVWIGGMAALGSRFFIGDIDEVAFFDREIDSTEMNDIMDNGLAPAAAPSAGQVISIQISSLYDIYKQFILTLRSVLT